jgi:hypothetical protein
MPGASCPTRYNAVMLNSDNMITSISEAKST